jgi:hypothetical protein
VTKYLSGPLGKTKSLRNCGMGMGEIVESKITTYDYSPGAFGLSSFCLFTHYCSSSGLRRWSVPYSRRIDYPRETTGSMLIRFTYNSACSNFCAVLLSFPGFKNWKASESKASQVDFSQTLDFCLNFFRDVTRAGRR